MGLAESAHRGPYKTPKSGFLRGRKEKFRGWGAYFKRDYLLEGAQEERKQPWRKIYLDITEDALQ